MVDLSDLESANLTFRVEFGNGRWHAHYEINGAPVYESGDTPHQAMERLWRGLVGNVMPTDDDSLPAADIHEDEL